VYFKDRSGAEEFLEKVNRQYSFAYRISKFTSLLRFLVKEIRGEWAFTEVDEYSTRIDWTYTFMPKNHIAAFRVRQIMIKDIHVLLGNALRIIKNDLEYYS
jgi:ribosome-associated toxin RatA of RatAB toxin-antitoxin module